MFLLLHLRYRLYSRLLCLIFFTSGPVSVQFASAEAHRPRESKRDEKRQIEDLEERWRRALIADDVAAADNLLSEDYVGISMSGQANTKMQQLERFRTHRLVIVRMQMSDSKVKLVGPVAIVTALAQVEGTNEGVSMTGKFRYTRIYQRLPSGVWKTTNFEATRIPGSRREGTMLPHQ